MINVFLGFPSQFLGASLVVAVVVAVQASVGWGGASVFGPAHRPPLMLMSCAIGRARRLHRICIIKGRSWLLLLLVLLVFSTTVHGRAIGRFSVD